MARKGYVHLFVLLIFLLGVTSGQGNSNRLAKLENLFHNEILRISSVERQLSEIKISLNQGPGPSESIANTTAVLSQILKDSLTFILSGLVNEHVQGIVTDRLTSIQAGLMFEKQQRHRLDTMAMHIKETLSKIEKGVSNNNSSPILKSLEGQTRLLVNKIKLLEKACNKKTVITEKPSSLVPKEKTPENGDLRLSDGLSETQGRVEMYYGGRWGTICDDNWDDEDSRVACRQQRFCGGQYSYYGPAQSHVPMHMGDVECNGREKRLILCQSYRDHGCSRESEATGVHCNHC